MGATMIDPSDMNDRAAAYAAARGFQLSVSLGYGKDGSVFASTVGRAVKVFATAGAFERELDCYRRLAEAGVRTILGLHVPQLKGWDEALHVIDMTIVARPFLLDFASAYLDAPPEFSPEVMEQWEQEGREKFGQDWSRVLVLLTYLQETFGIYLLDVHPGNIAFHVLP
jgi:hypothetical protein